MSFLVQRTETRHIHPDDRRRHARKIGGRVNATGKPAFAMTGSGGQAAAPIATRGSSRYGRRLLVFGAVIALLVVLAAIAPLHDYLDGVIRKAAGIIDAHPITGPFLFILVSSLSAMMVFFSSALLVPVAVVTWGREATLFLLWIGWLAGGALSYAVGRYPGRSMLRWLVRPRLVRKYERRFSSRTALPLVVLLQLAMPSEVPGYLLGSVRYSFSRYMLVLALAELPYGIGAVYLGDGLARGEAWRVALVALTGAVVSMSALVLFHRRVAGGGAFDSET
jgi:uncharacterized membrane protein YdjX (TVP38/TMEM64 family)